MKGVMQRTVGGNQGIAEWAVERRGLAARVLVSGSLDAGSH